MSLDDLRGRWRERYGAPPKLRSPELLAHLLAWRLQAEQAGGIDAKLRLALRRRVGARTASDPNAGVVLARVWEGVSHEVEVLKGGEFLYRGDRYRSLSQIARLITGARWNGPRFFGLREKEATV